MEPDIYKSPESKLEIEPKETRMKLTAKTLFKIIFIGYFFGMGSLLLLDGIYSLLSGAESVVSFNGENLAGIAGFVGALVFIPIASVIFTLFNWVILLFGNWLYSLIRGPVKLEFKN